ncbi:uncharacterized protein LOC113346615 isoform X1 [Papaver somniferum]|uniref:uncharacterized protein LOC113346615 isoform X1 n=1 Tax=Papaver somniferum TaxID=3469 RepID=UPI000E6F90D6|nr:uncharacterized protein LOC113346615 isoform X1 [Papaver somniferum]
MDWIINSLQMIIIQSTCLGLQQIGMILCAIAMAAYDQEKPELCKNLIKTKDGIASLALFHSLVGSQGELPQAFHRCAAVKVHGNGAEEARRRGRKKCKASIEQSILKWRG